MRICAAQLEPVAGDIDLNVAEHLALIDLAIAQRADLIFFPELSLTGYEPRLAKSRATDADDHRIDVLQKIANAKQIIIGVGLPTRSPSGVRISMIVFQPGKQRLAYSKQQLHADEVPFFVQGNEQLIITAGDHALAPAICYESLQPGHADNAARAAADIYLASVAKPARNVVKAYPHYAAMARQHSMTVLMANSIGPCDNFVSVGQSAIWNDRGELIAGMDDKSEGLVLIDTGTQEATTVPI